MLNYWFNFDKSLDAEMISILRKKLSETELNEILENLLQQSMMMNRTRAGTLQLLNKKNHTLEIATSSGLSSEFIEHFKTVTIDDGSVCGRALKDRKTIFIEDLTKDDAFSRHLNLALQNHIVAVQSTPLITRNGNFIGIISTHFRSPGKISKASLGKFEKFCSEAADKIEELTRE